MLGARIAALRRQRNMSQQELAQLLTVSPSAVGMYEQGRREPPLETVVALSEVFQVSTDYLLTGRPGRQEQTALQQMLQQRLDAASRRSGGFSREELAVLFAAMLMDAPDS